MASKEQQLNRKLDNGSPTHSAHGKITTLFPEKPEVSAIAVTDGTVSAIGGDDDILALADDNTQKINLNKRRVIPGLNDSHLHVIRAGLFYNLELRWDGVPSLSQALEQLKQQADITPPPQWLRVIGGSPEDLELLLSNRSPRFDQAR